MEIVTSWMEEGIEKGRQVGAAHTLLRVLARRFGPVPAELAAGVGALPVDALDRLAEELLDLSALADLERWLERTGPARKRRPANR